ncbi:MAG TPA: hypothetical protein VMT74_12530 [Gaiellaceae bacterium]|nr:hypothetical protein [Gaiellaceae bacterium]
MADPDRRGVLTERLDALARALRAAGVAPAASERLLGAAAAAAMDALAIDLILAAAPAAAPPGEPPRDAQPVPLAA